VRCTTALTKSGTEGPQPGHRSRQELASQADCDVQVVWEAAGSGEWWVNHHTQIVSADTLQHYRGGNLFGKER